MTEYRSTKTTLILITVSLLVVSAAAIAAYSDPTQTNEKIVDWKYSTNTTYPIDSLTVTQERVYFIGSPPSKIDDFPEDIPVYIYSLNSSSGEEAWRFNISRSRPARNAGNTQDKLTLRDGTVYASGVDGRIYAVDSDSGTEEWNMSIRHWVNSDVVPFNTVSGGVAYVGGYTGVDGEVRALDATTGRLLWNSSINNSIYLTGTVSENTLYISGGELNKSNTPEHREILVALNASSGERIWSYNTSNTSDGGILYHRPVVGDDLVYVRYNPIMNNSGVVRGINVTTGQQEWESYSDGLISTAVLGSVAVSDGRVYYPSDGIYALDASTGEVIWKYDFPESISSIETTPVVKRGTVYVGVDDDLGGEPPHVFALDAGSGELEWSVTSGKRAPHVGSPAIMNNRLYIGGNGTVYSLNLTALNESDKKSHVIDGGYGGGGMFSDGLIP